VHSFVESPEMLNVCSGRVKLDEVDGDRFRIAGGTPGLVVSWQVTGVRRDAWARQNPMRVEPLKAKNDRGKFLQPQVVGKRRSTGIMSLPNRQPRKLQRNPAAIPARLRGDEAR